MRSFLHLTTPARCSGSRLLHTLENSVNTVTGGGLRRAHWKSVYTGNNIGNEQVAGGASGIRMKRYFHVIGARMAEAGEEPGKEVVNVAEGEDVPLMGIQKKASVKKAGVKVKNKPKEVDPEQFANVVWPAPPKAIDTARLFLLDAAKSVHPVLLIPDRGADGLCAGTIINHTLRLLGKSPSQIHVHFTHKGRSIFDPAENEEIERVCKEKGIESLIILDQGSIEHAQPHTSVNEVSTVRKVLSIDHHHSPAYPTHATTLNSRYHPPIAPTSLLTYSLCSPLHGRAKEVNALPALIGTIGYLPSLRETLKVPPWPTYLGNEALEKYKITWINKLIVLINVARRTPLLEGEEATYGAWKLLQFDPAAPEEEWPTPKGIMTGTWGGDTVMEMVNGLRQMQDRSKEEFDKNKRRPPRYSDDGRIAVIELSSKWQIQSMIAARWSSYLGGSKRRPGDPPALAVACANTDYVPGGVTFSVRRTGIGIQQNVNLTSLLKEYRSQLSQEWQAKLGDDFSLGHNQGAGGTVPTDVWEAFKKDALKLRGQGQVGSSGQTKPSGQRTLDMYPMGRS